MDGWNGWMDGMNGWFVWRGRGRGRGGVRWSIGRESVLTDEQAKMMGRSKREKQGVADLSSGEIGQSRDTSTPSHAEGALEMDGMN
jgi:hypothetical protein